MKHSVSFCFKTSHVLILTYLSPPLVSFNRSRLLQAVINYFHKHFHDIYPEGQQEKEIPKDLRPIVFKLICTIVEYGKDKPAPHVQVGIVEKHYKVLEQMIPWRWSAGESDFIQSVEELLTDRMISQFHQKHRSRCRMERLALLPLNRMLRLLMPTSNKLLLKIRLPLNGLQRLLMLQPTKTSF